MNLSTVLTQQISLQKNAWSDLGEEITILEALKIIKCGNFGKEILILREFLEKSEYEKYNAYKKRLPGVTFSGTFDKHRRKENLRNYNNLLVIDIDKLNEEELIKTKENLLFDPYVFTCWESPSKNGMKGLIYLEFEHTIIKEDIHEEHKWAFDLVYEYFLRSYNIILDKSASDITRLCFVSFDPNLIIKDAVPFNIKQSFNKTKPIKSNTKRVSITSIQSARPIKKSFLDPIGKNSPSDRKSIQSIIKYLSKRSLSITSNYDNWYRVAYAIANSFTYDLGENYYLKLCRLDGMKHDEDQSKYLLYYCYDNTKGEISFKTIYYLAMQQGYKKKGGSEGASEN